MAIENACGELVRWNRESAISAIRRTEMLTNVLVMEAETKRFGSKPSRPHGTEMALCGTRSARFERTFLSDTHSLAWLPGL